MMPKEPGEAVSPEKEFDRSSSDPLGGLASPPPSKPPVHSNTQGNFGSRYTACSLHSRSRMMVCTARKYALAARTSPVWLCLDPRSDCGGPASRTRTYRTIVGGLGCVQFLSLVQQPHVKGVTIAISDKLCTGAGCPRPWEVLRSARVPSANSSQRKLLMNMEPVCTPSHKVGLGKLNPSFRKIFPRCSGVRPL